MARTHTLAKNPGEEFRRRTGSSRNLLERGFLNRGNFWVNCWPFVEETAVFFPLEDEDTRNVHFSLFLSLPLRKFDESNHLTDSFFFGERFERFESVLERGIGLNFAFPEN